MSLLDDIIDFFYRLFGYRRVTATSVLSTNGGTPVPNGSVTLSYSKEGGESWTQDGTGLTDQTGTATEHVYLRRGSYAFRVNFSGGGGYGPSQAQTSATV